MNSLPDNLIWLDSGFAVNKDEIVCIRLYEFKNKEIDFSPIRVQWSIVLKNNIPQHFGPIFSDSIKAITWLKERGLKD